MHHIGEKTMQETIKRTRKRKYKKLNTYYSRFSNIHYFNKSYFKMMLIFLNMKLMSKYERNVWVIKKLRPNHTRSNT